MSNNSNMSKLIQLVEGQQFASEPTQQLADQELIHNRLVGEDTTLEDTLAKKYSNFKDVQSKKNSTNEIQKPKKQGVAEAAGLYGPFTVTINTGERPKSRTKTKKFRKEDDAILWAEDWLEDAPQYVFATAEVTDPNGNVVWVSEESMQEGLNEATADSKIASLEKKIQDARDAMGLARERRRMKGQRQQGTREMALQKKIDGLRQQIDTIEREAAQTNESKELSELSTSLLGKYKTAAGKAASEADKRGDFETGHKRFKGIMKATKKQFANDSKSAKKESAELGEASGNPVDTITMDVPLMIRIMEYAREDAQTDMDLHDVAEQLIKLGASGQTLTMQDYNSVVGQQTENKIFELGASNLPTAQTTKPISPTTSTATQQTQANTSPTTTTTSSSPTTAAKPASSTTTTAAAPAKLNPDEQTALNKIMANAGLKGQFQQLIQKAKTVPGA